MKPHTKRRLGWCLLAVDVGLLVLAVAGLVHYQHVGWGEGYRTEDWAEQGALSLFIIHGLSAFVAGTYLVIVRLWGGLRPYLPPVVATAALIGSWFLAPTHFRNGLRKGHAALLSETDLNQLARELIEIAESRPRFSLADGRFLFPKDWLLLPPMLRRWRPSYIVVEPERVRVEMHGGFEHYGYEIHRREDHWALMWDDPRLHVILTVPFERRRSTSRPR